MAIDFTPAPSVHEPDVSGTIYLDPKTFQLRSTLLLLVNLTKSLGEQTSGQAVRANFKEDHRTLSVRFLRGRP